MLSPFLLTSLLLDTVAKAPEPRIVITSSISQVRVWKERSRLRRRREERIESKKPATDFRRRSTARPQPPGAAWERRRRRAPAFQHKPAQTWRRGQELRKCAPGPRAAAPRAGPAPGHYRAFERNAPRGGDARRLRNPAGAPALSLTPPPLPFMNSDKQCTG